MGSGVFLYSFVFCIIELKKLILLLLLLLVYPINKLLFESKSLYTI